MACAPDDMTRADFNRYFRALRWTHLGQRFRGLHRGPNLHETSEIEHAVRQLNTSLQLLAPRPAQLPRQIFMLWQQGWNAAPHFVKACGRSWQNQNPNWQVHLLSEDDVAKWAPDYADAAGNIRGRAARSDMARMALLRRHGGVWADATTFCTRPLDAWIDRAMLADMFVFTRPYGYRPVSSWFIAAPPESPTITALWQLLKRYWSLFDRPHRYFWLHYLYLRLAELDPDVGRNYAALPELHSTSSFVVARNAFRRDAPAAVWRLIDDKTVPVHKLTHKWRRTGAIDGTPLARLTGLERL